MGNSRDVVYWRNRTKLKLIEYKGGKCQRCGYNKPIPSVYDFHHRNPEEKEFSITAKTISFEKLKAEADKCDLLCANCHREVHYELIQERREREGLPHRKKTCQGCGCNFETAKHKQSYCNRKCFKKHYDNLCKTKKTKL
jgi:hypothetical protein